MDRPQIDLEMHERLVAWARWARGRYLPSCLTVRCLSIESRFAAPIGSVYDTVEEALKASIRASEAKVSRGDEWQTERAVSGLPERPKTALRLHYVEFKRMPMVQKRRILACTEQEYWLILLRAAQMLRNRLTIKGEALELEDMRLSAISGIARP